MPIKVEKETFESGETMAVQYVIALSMILFGSLGRAGETRPVYSE